MGDVAAGGQLFVEGCLDGVEAGHQTTTVLCHVGQNALLILEEADVAQLVHLIVADDHDREALADVLHHGLAARQSGNASAREGDLAGGGEHKDAVFIAVLLAFVQQDGGLDDLLRQMVDDVSLIPEDLEVGGGGLHLGEAVDGLVAVGVAVRVGILRHAPDALDGVILGHQLLDDVHVGAVRGHGDADQLEAELLGDGKMAVIAGHRAEELPLLHLRPRAGRLRETEAVAHRDEVVHQLQAGVAAHKDLLGLHAHHIGEQLTGLMQALQIAVVAGVGAGVGGVIRHLQQTHCQIHLVRAGLAAGHVQLQAHRLKLFVFFFQSRLFGSQFVAGHLKIICHNTHSFIVRSISHRVRYCFSAKQVHASGPLRFLPSQFQTFIVYYNLTSETSRMAQKDPAKK